MLEIKMNQMLTLSFLEKLFPFFPSEFQNEKVLFYVKIWDITLPVRRLINSLVNTIATRIN